MTPACCEYHKVCTLIFPQVTFLPLLESPPFLFLFPKRVINCEGEKLYTNVHSLSQNGRQEMALLLTALSGKHNLYLNRKFPMWIKEDTYSNGISSQYLGPCASLPFVHRDCSQNKKSTSRPSHATTHKTHCIHILTHADCRCTHT